MNNSFIMIVDDDPVSLRVLELLIKNINPSLTVVKFPNAAAVLKYLKENSENPNDLPDLISLIFICRG